MSPRTIQEMRQVFRFDDEVGELVWAVGRGRTWEGKWAGSVIGDGKRAHREVKLRGKIYRVDEVVWAMHYGEAPPSKIEHIDGDDLNCRIENMRLKGRMGS